MEGTAKRTEPKIPYDRYREVVRCLLASIVSQAEAGILVDHYQEYVEEQWAAGATAGVAAEGVLDLFE